MPTMIFGSKQTMQMLYGVDFTEEDKLLDSLVVTQGRLASLGGGECGHPAPTGWRTFGVQVGETILIRLETLNRTAERWGAKSGCIY